jgi:PEP-CTERM motif
MRYSSLALIAALLAAISPLSLEAQYVWTGQGNGWQGQVTPPNNGSADLYFGNSIYPFVPISSSLDIVSSINLEDGNSITFTAASPIDLQLGSSGIGSTDPTPGTLDFTSNINIAISGATTFDAGQNSVYVRGQLTGSGPLTLIGSGGISGSGVFVFNNIAGNTYSGNTTIGDGASFITVAFWNSSPFGAGGGIVTLANGGELITHNVNNTIPNDLVIDSLGNSFALVLKSWDGPVTYAGSVTLDANATFLAREPTAALPAPNNSGSIPVPGQPPTNPIIFSGSIGQSGPYSLTVNGDGIIMLTGTGNTYTGGTFVGSSGGAAGALVFGSASSFPFTGMVQVFSNGYLGTADPTTGSFAALIAPSNVNLSTSTGSFGIDTLPGNPTTTYSGPVDLSGFASSSVDIGTSTSAILTGTITPQTLGAYRFGGGGGTLYVDTPLVNIGSSTVLVTNAGNSLPLTVYLEGANTYIGTTTVNDGFAIFDGPTAIPYLNANSFVAGGSGSVVGGSYIGYTDQETNIASPASFVGLFNKASTWGIIGFDSSNTSSPVSISNVDLTGFHDGVFIGTATAAMINGSITPSNVLNTFQTANTIRLTAAQAGVLTVNSNIADNGSPVSLILGSPSYTQYSSGTVILNGSSTFTGGTTINAASISGIASEQTVAIGSNSAFGTGGISITPGGMAALSATSGGINVANNITFLDPTPPDSSELLLRGTNSFTLSGAITGDSSSTIVLENASPLTVTLSGNNSAFAGSFQIYNGTLKLPNANSLGAGNIEFAGPGTLDLTSALAPVIENIGGGEGNNFFGHIMIGSNQTLTFDTTNDSNNANPTFGGVISGSGSSVVVTDATGISNAVVLLYGNNTYDGGTTITQNGVLAVASDNALGTGPVLVNATPQNGGLALDSGVTLTNPLTLTSGNLFGDGTVNPGNAGLGGTVTIGTNVGVAGGLPFGDGNTAISGTLSFAGNLKFSGGGSYYWTLQDNARPDGASSLAVAGNLDLTALTTSSFNLGVYTFDTTGNVGLASNFNPAAPASWTIVTTGGTILGFNAANFLISAAGFENGSFTGTNFFLTENGAQNQLILNFTPVPEPSTWALLGVGLGMMGFIAIRSRRRAADVRSSP